MTEKLQHGPTIRGTSTITNMLVLLLITKNTPNTFSKTPKRILKVRNKPQAFMGFSCFWLFRDYFLKSFRIDGESKWHYFCCKYQYLLLLTFLCQHFFFATPSNILKSSMSRTRQIYYPWYQYIPCGTYSLYQASPNDVFAL